MRMTVVKSRNGYYEWDMLGKRTYFKPKGKQKSTVLRGVTEQYWDAVRKALRKEGIELLPKEVFE